MVVDNGSSVAPSVDFRGWPFDVELLFQLEGGSYAARNRGIASSSGAIVAFTDADCLPTHDWISKAVSYFLDQDVDAVAGQVEVFPRDPDNPNLIEMYELIHAFPQQQYVEELGFGVTANLVVTARALAELGNFDPHLRSGGDRDFGERLKRGDLVLVYGHDVVVLHPARTSIREWYDKRLRVILGALAIRRERGEEVRTGFRVAARQLLPPVGAVRRARSDARLADNRSRVRYVAAAVVVRYLDFVAWRVAVRAVLRAGRAPH
jgi:glycosyltransferase involved in cell wall biosynthesis